MNARPKKKRFISRKDYLENLKDKVDFSNQKESNVSSKKVLMSLSGEEKVGLLFHALGEDVRLLFPHIDDITLQRAYKAYKKIKKVPVNVFKEVLLEFYQQLNEDQTYILGTDNLDADKLKKSLGKERFQKIFGKDTTSLDIAKIDCFDNLDSETIHLVLQDEHAQTIALALSFLSAKRKSEVITLFDSKYQSTILTKMVTIDKVDPSQIRALNNLLKEKIYHMNINTKRLNGAKIAAEILTHMDQNRSKDILKILEQKDPKVAEKVREYQFTIDHITELDSTSFRSFLQMVDQDALKLTLKKAKASLWFKIREHTSARAYKMLKEDVESLAPQPLKKVESAEKLIVNLCLKKIEKGIWKLVQSNEPYV